jgi:drug/metabolite transporter (DMT)-like permease
VLPVPRGGGVTGIVYVIGTVAFTVIGQLMLKWRMAVAGSLPDSLVGTILFLLQRLLDGWVLIGLLSAAAAAMCWMAALTTFELSRVYPFMATSFVLVLILSAPLLGEPISWGKVIGTLVVILGVVLMGILP